jgi:hypothetical protein
MCCFAACIVVLTDKTVPNSKLIDKFRSEKWSMWSLTQGLQLLPETLGNYLTKQSDLIDIRLETSCAGINFADYKAKVRIFLFAPTVRDRFTCNSCQWHCQKHGV